MLSLLILIVGVIFIIPTILKTTNPTKKQEVIASQLAKMLHTNPHLDFWAKLNSIEYVFSWYWSDDIVSFMNAEVTNDNWAVVKKSYFELTKQSLYDDLIIKLDIESIKQIKVMWS